MTMHNLELHPNVSAELRFLTSDSTARQHAPIEYTETPAARTLGVFEPHIIYSQSWRLTNADKHLSLCNLRPTQVDLGTARNADMRMLVESESSIYPILNSHSYFVRSASIG